MAGTILRNSANTHDQDTGLLTGYVNPKTGKEEALDAAGLQALVSRGGKLAYTMIPIGDSIVYTSGCAGMYEHAAALAGGRFSVIRNAGINGNTSTQMLARFADDVVAYAPHFVALQGSVNNIGAGISVATLVSDYTEMIALARAAAITPIIVAMPPYDSQPATISSYNRALWRLAQTLRVQFVDPWPDITNGTTGAFAASMASDGTHPTQTALRLGAIRFNSALTLPTYQPLLPNNNADSGNKISNGLFITNTVPGTPDGWSVDAAFTSTVTAASLPALGNYWDLAFSGLGAYKVCSGPLSFSGIAGGDVFALVGRMKGASLEANGKGTSPGQSKVDATMYLTFSGPGGGVELSPSFGADLDGVFVKVFTVPVGTVGMSFGVLIGPRSGTISGTLSFAQVGLFKLS